MNLINVKSNVWVFPRSSQWKLVGDIVDRATVHDGIWLLTHRTIADQCWVPITLELGKVDE